MKIIIGTKALHYARHITMAIIDIMEHHRGCLGVFEDHAAYQEIIDRAREARTALDEHGDEGIPLAALLMERSAGAYLKDTGANHMGLCRIASELRDYAPEAIWEDPERIMEERAPLFARAGGE